ncbi:UbiA family prenyltransferase [Methylobacterium isbiliense]|uniref:Protoheme IX farnesyltransferase n=1 Tax=Methylobacterium isbiliense TaxID=315478 RepID=A0ABQ4S988_9HYPH|nr:UbiA family prenyltransferase [Methylobacterium isbiliense]MDN3623566.1 UbiA family prenyltransferase [Methylobacterium isbiliense]GJD99770.1 Protoheme IX farnesyltransferase [Methylobacterium isbiliense]
MTKMQAPPERSGVGTPLVVDLDGTLLRTNLLFECVLAFLRLRPLGLFLMLGWLARGRAHLKQELARRIPLDPKLLPVNEEFYAYLTAERARGRRTYLATAADAEYACAIAAYYGPFDGVLASDGTVNLKGQRKAERLADAFPEGFSYAGDSRADEPVWSHAAEVIAVGGTRITGRAAKFGKPVITFLTPAVLPALAECARPHQWAKNLLVLAPAVLGGVADDPSRMLRVLIALAALCIIASSTYILNDLLDVADDRRHWSKRQRPIASGRLPVAVAAGAVPLGLAVGFALGALVGPAVVATLLVYTLLTVAYSLSLKRMPIVDVMVLAGLYTLRLVLGTVAAAIAPSLWLLVFSMFLFGSLCFAKRFIEVERWKERGEARVANRGYEAVDSPLLFALGIGTAIASTVTIVLYIIFDIFPHDLYRHAGWLWAFPVILFLWSCRIWLAAGRHQLDDDPVAFALNDRPSLLLGAALLSAFVLAWSAP